MILRNKKTGEIVETEEDYFYMTFSNDVLPKDGFTSIKNFNEIWEDYKQTEPLIKDEKIRKAVRAWAEANNINNVVIREQMCNCTMRDVCEIMDERVEICLVKGLEHIADGEQYTVAELCGEEE